MILMDNISNKYLIQWGKYSCFIHGNDNRVNNDRQTYESPYVLDILQMRKFTTL